MTNLPSLMHCPLYSLIIEGGEKKARRPVSENSPVAICPSLGRLFAWRFSDWANVRGGSRLARMMFSPPRCKVVHPCLWWAGQGIWVFAGDSAESWFGYTRSPHIDVFRLFLVTFNPWTAHHPPPFQALQVWLLHASALYTEVCIWLTSCQVSFLYGLFGGFLRFLHSDTSL